MKKSETEKSNSSFRLAAIDSRQLDANTEPLQTGFWGLFKARFGWRAHSLRVENGDAGCALLVLSRRLGPGLTLAYIPLGPSLPEPAAERETWLVALARAIALARDNQGSPLVPADTFVLRFDLPWHREGAGSLPAPLVEGRYLKKAVMDVQPPSTVLLDLRLSEHEILAGMKSKTRYNVRLSLKKGVTVEEAAEDQLGAWYRLYLETGRRDRIAVHSEQYFREMLRMSREYGEGAPEYRLLMARHEGDLLAGIIVGFRGKRAWYPFGASAGLKRNLMPAYALQWRAIQLARRKGCRTYDLFGIPPAGDREHPMFGLYQFKVGFGGTIVNRCGCWDAVVRKPRYTLFRAAERARRYFYLDLRKRARFRTPS